MQFSAQDSRQEKRWKNDFEMYIIEVRVGFIGKQEMRREFSYAIFSSRQQTGKGMKE